MARRLPRCPDPSAVTRLVPPSAPRLLRVKWWLLAPALAALGGVGALLYIRSQYVSFEDLREQHADTQRHMTPWFLWVKRSPDSVVVAEQPGGGPPPGTWELVEDHFLAGDYVTTDDDGSRTHVPWTGEFSGWTVTVDGEKWERAGRRAVPPDFDALGQAPALVGRWRVGQSDDAWVELRADGTMINARGNDIGRWAGNDEVIVTHANERWRNLALRVFVRDGHDPGEFGADVIYATTGQCEIDVLFRPSE